MSALATTMIYAFDVAEQTHYYFDQSEANQAYAKAELAVEHPDWREPMTVLELLEIKDALLGEFVKRIAFLELQLERVEMGSDSFDLDAD
ncbi:MULTISPECIES: hypothetical protein [unclassified Agarivorans]|uniref:hypothetical protein n=1 Tax=unclassified Agarivorans TaxID=2636026 RepID=UPI003D7EAC82